MDEKQEDRIDDYLLGKMTPEEEADFRKKLAYDPQLRDRCKFTAMVKDIVTEHARLESMMDECDSEIKAGKPAASVPVHHDKKHKAWVLYVITGVAAVMLAAVILVSPNKEKRSVDMMNCCVQNIKLHTATAYYANISKLIDEGRYEEALEQIERAELDLIYSKCDILCADSIAASDSVAVADSVAAEQPQHNDDEMVMRHDQLTWLKVCAYIGMGDDFKAMQSLEILRNHDNEWRKQADSLYNRLEEQ